MTSDLPVDDDDLMATLRQAAAETDPVPESVAALARAALATRRLDEELADLLLDSQLVAADAVRAADGDVRVLSFEAAGVVLELQVDASTSLRGLAIGTTGQAVVETPGQTRDVRIGPDGWFTVPDLPGGPTRVRVHATDGRRVVTPWVRF